MALFFVQVILSFQTKLHLISFDLKKYYINGMSYKESPAKVFLAGQIVLVYFFVGLG